MQKRQVGKTDLYIEVLGLGGAPLGGNNVDASPEQATELLNATRDAGINYFDTAPWYGFGRSERAIGDYLRGSDYVLSDKVGRLLKPGLPENPLEFGMYSPLPFHVVYDYGYDGIMRAYEDNLQRLGLDRIDMLFVHDIGAFTHGEENDRHFADLKAGGYKALDELRSQGLVKAIGLGVNENEVCMDALDIGDWDVFLLAGRYTLLEQTSLDALFPACEAAGTSIICGGPFNSGALVGGDTWNYAKAPESVMNKVKQLKEVADSFSVPLAAAALQFPLAHDLITSVIPGPGNVTEFNQIIDWFNTPIPAAFWTALQDKGLVDERAPLPAGA